MTNDNIQEKNENHYYEMNSMHTHDHKDTIWGIVVFLGLVVGMVVLAHFFA